MALDYAQQGITTLEEVIKVSEYVELDDLAKDEGAAL
jgi:hypothetical protein